MGSCRPPGRADEDRRGGFEQGGWAVPFADSVIGGLAGEGTAATDGLLLGRRTYEDFYGFWPNQTDNPFTEVLNNTQKYVASTTLQEPLAWSNSTLLKGDAAEAVAGLKEQPGNDLVVLGSGALVQSLMRRNLVDEFMLLIHPLVLGSGRRSSPTAARRPLSGWLKRNVDDRRRDRNLPNGRAERNDHGGGGMRDLFSLLPGLQTTWHITTPFRGGAWSLVLSVTDVTPSVFQFPRRRGISS